MGQFKLIPQPMGSGWISMHVAVDEYYSWEDTRGEICLTLDTQNADEVCYEIDKLIEELNNLKITARRKYAGWNGHELTKRKRE